MQPPTASSNFPEIKVPALLTFLALLFGFLVGTAFQLPHPGEVLLDYFPENFGTSAEMWLAMQVAYDLRHARQKKPPKAAQIIARKAA